MLTIHSFVIWDWVIENKQYTESKHWICGIFVYACEYAPRGAVKSRESRWRKEKINVGHAPVSTQNHGVIRGVCYVVHFCRVPWGSWHLWQSLKCSQMRPEPFCRRYRLRYLTFTEIIVKLLQMFPTDVSSSFYSKMVAKSQLLGQIFAFNWTQWPVFTQLWPLL